MSQLNDVRGRPVRPGDLIAWADSHKRGRIRHGEVTAIKDTGTPAPTSHRFRVVIIEDTDDRDEVTTIKNTSNIILVEAFADERPSLGRRIEEAKRAATKLAERFYERGQLIGQ